MATGTIQLKRSQWQWIDVYVVDVNGVPQTALTVTDFAVRYKKNNAVAFTTKTLLGTTTTVSANALAGVTSLSVADITSFNLTGNVNIDRGGGNQELNKAYSNIPGEDTTIRFPTVTAQPHVATEVVELIDFYEVGVGVYTFLFSDSELDTVGQFTAAFTPAGVGLQVVKDIDIIPAEAVISDPFTAPSMCTIFGYVADIGATALENIGVSARILALPSIVSSSIAIGQDPVAVRTDSNGYFYFDLIQGATVDIVIPATDFRRTIIVPSTDNANLFEIAAA